MFPQVALYYYWSLFLLISLPTLSHVLSIVTNDSTQAKAANKDHESLSRKFSNLQKVNSDNQTQTSNTKLESLDRNLMSARDNATFYYDPDSFLLQTINNKSTKPPSSVIKAQLNSTRDVSARNGRMLDLDELVGDFTQAKLNKQNRISGDRQSRILNDSPIEIGQGKKLSIQGFIPIMTIKDLSNDDKDDNQPSETISKKTSINQEDGALVNQHFSSLPYGQSSPGHASVGVRPYSESYDDSHMAAINLNNLQHRQQAGVDAKYLGSGSTNSNSGYSSLNPFKKAQNKKLSSSSGLSMLNSLISVGSLSGLSSNSQNNQADATNPLESNPDNFSGCVCVPFYMCRSGYLSESSLTKDQVQQLIQSQQQQAQQQQQNQQTMQHNQYLQGKQNTDDIYPSTVINQQQMVTQAIPLQQQQQQQQQQNQLLQDSYVPVDERSMDKQIDDNQQQNSNETYQSQSAELLNRNEPSQTSNNSINLGGLSQYSQDILGRMLELKNEANSCGVLRTCCKVKSTTQNQGNNQRVASLAQLQSMQNSQLVPYQQQLSKPVQQQMPTPLSMQMSQQYQQQQQQQQNVIYRPNNNMAFTQVIPDSFAHRHQMQTRQQVPQLPTLQQTNLNYKVSQSYIQAPLNHQMNQPVPSINQLQPYQPIKSYGPSTLNTDSTIQQSHYQPNPLSAQYQQAYTHSNSLDTSQKQNNQLSSPLRHQMIETNQGVGQLSHQQVLPPILTRSSPSNPPLNQRRMLEGRCGVRNAAGITGRVQNLQYEPTSADFGEYPSQVAILKRLAGSDSLYVCAGTLISQRWIATAAHCIKKYSNTDLKVRLGEWDVHRDDEFYPFVEKNIRDIVIHPEFMAGNLVNDIALLRMESMVDASLPHIGPACLPNSDEIFTGLRCWVTGWGKDTFGQKGSFQSVLKEVDLPITSHRDCEQALKQTRLGQHYRLHSGFICAGGEGGKDACEGDGGSGLYCVQEGLIKAVGLVSWGIGCGQAGVPGVYVNLAHYRVWIENIISIDEDLYGPIPGVMGSNSLISERSPGASVNTSSSENTTKMDSSQEFRSASLDSNPLINVTDSSSSTEPSYTLPTTTPRPRNETSSSEEAELRLDEDPSDFNE